MSAWRTGRAVFLAVLVLVLFQTGASLAQDTTPQASTPADPPSRRIVAWTNPILLVFGWYMVEGEVRLRENHTVGISGSFLDFKTDDPGDPDYEETEYYSINLFYRYYPKASFKGFFIGVQMGTAEVNQKENVEDNFGIPTGETEETSGNAYSAGVLIGYGWLLGDAQRIAVSMGIGANRLFGGDVDEDANPTVPVIRLINVGIAF